MNVVHLNQFQMNVRTHRGRTSVILKGDVNEKAAWRVLKKLETFQPSMYPIHLHLGGVGTMHWFAANILRSGVEHLLKSRGEIFLVQKGKNPEPFSQGDFLPVMSFADGVRDEV